MSALRETIRQVPSVRSSGAARRWRPAAAAALAALLGAAVPALGAAPAHAEEAAVTEGRLLKQLYMIGVGRLARGDPAGAVQPFQVVSEVAPELPQGHYSLAMAMVLSDFQRRARALPIIAKALAHDASHPLYTIVQVLADSAASTLGADGALYLSAAGSERMRSAAAWLGRVAEGRNSRYLAPVLSALEPTGDAAQPLRLAGFDKMVGPDGSVAIARAADPVSFSRLFVVTIPDERFDTHHAKVAARLPRGVESLTEPQSSLLGEVSTMELLVDRGRVAARRGPFPHVLDRRAEPRPVEIAAIDGAASR